MKKSFCTLFVLMIGTCTYAQSCYYYVKAAPGQIILEDVSLKRIITNVFSAPCIDYGTRSGAIRMTHSIESQFNDSIQIEYGNKAIIGNRQIWISDFKTESEAKKDRRRVIADLIKDDYKIINFNFEYYED